MAKIDFSKIIIKDIDGNEITVDVRRGINGNGLGNVMYMNGADIVECETGSKIYHSEGEIKLNDDEVKAVRKFIGGYPYITRHAIELLLNAE